MDTIDAQLFLLTLVEHDGTAVAPDAWHHDLARGSLTWRFAGSENSYTWKADAVRAIAARARRASSPRPSPELAERAARWRRSAEIICAAGERPDDLVIDLASDEMTFRWRDHHLVVIVGDDDPGLPAAA